MKNIILIGGGGHCKSVIDSLNELNEFYIAGILDVREKVGTEVNNVEVIGVDEDLDYFYRQGVENAFITLGSLGNPGKRVELYRRAAVIGFKFPPVIDRTAVISATVEINQGAFVGKGAIINSNARIGANCIINTGVIIEHDCIIGDFCHLAPGSTISGGVNIAENTHIGTNATVIQNIRVGKNSLIGAGSVVVSDIGDDKKAYGNPCREV